MTGIPRYDKVFLAMPVYIRCVEPIGLVASWSS